ncbi:elongation factor G-like protein [Leptospira sp. 96542]|nr:elongation factor G-like protein [Leptospira sp. 96542]
MAYRTVGIFAHIDSGKTTLTERILFEAGLISAMGSIEDGTTESDVLTEEIERGISIRTSFHSVPWKQNQCETILQIIDTPGHIDFRNQVTDLLPAIQTAIVILEAGNVVQSQARLVVEELVSAKIPIVFFINKLDRFGEEYLDTLISLEDLLGFQPTILFQSSPLGHEYYLSKPEAFPDKTKEDLMAWNDELLLAAWNDPITTKNNDLIGLKQGPKEGKLFPVYGGSAKTGEGVRELLDLVLWTDPKEEKTKGFYLLSRRRDPDFGRYLVCYAKSKIFFPTKKGEYFPEVLQAYGGSDFSPFDFVEPGQLFLLSGGSLGLSEPRAFFPDDGTQNQENHLYQFGRSPFSVVLEPERKGDKEFWTERLEDLTWEDPGYSLVHLEETGQIRLFGRGELHLEIGIRRIQEKTEKKLHSSAINIAKFELFKKMSHKVALEHRAFEDNQSSGTLIAVLEDTADFSKQVAFEVSLPEEVKHSIETAFHESVMRGFYGMEVLGVRMRVTSYSPPNLITENTFTLLKVATLAGLKSVFQENTEMVGPLTEVEVAVDANHLGVVLSDLNRRHAKIISIEEEVAGKSHLKAKASAENMLGFSGALRNMTKGIGISWERTAFTSEFYAVLKE